MEIILEDKFNNWITIKKESLCNETKFILLRLKTSKDIFKTELLKIYKIVTNTKGTLSIRRRRKKTKKQKETLQNVSNNNVTRTKISIN